MNRYLKYGLIAALVVAVIGITAVSVVSAQTDDPPRPHELLAELLGMTEDELHEAMHSGKTLQELAADADLDLDQILQALQDARAEAFRYDLEQALANGDITQEQYDWALQGLENGYWGGGRGPGGFFGHGMSPDDPKERPFGFGDGIRPFGGRGGGYRFERPGMDCGRDWIGD